MFILSKALSFVVLILWNINIARLTVKMTDATLGQVDFYGPLAQFVISVYLIVEFQAVFFRYLTQIQLCFLVSLAIVRSMAVWLLFFGTYSVHLIFVMREGEPQGMILPSMLMMFGHRGFGLVRFIFVFT